MKLIVTLTLGLCLYMCASAQLHWAIVAGPQTSAARYTRADGKVTTQNVTGFLAGIATKVYFDNKVAFISGLQFNARGFQVKTIPGDTLRKYSLQYIDLPAMFRFDLGKKAGNGFYLVAGPSVSIGIHGSETHTGANGTVVKRKVVMSVTGNNFGMYDAAVNGGLGYSVQQKFFAEVMYAYGAGNINNDTYGPNIKSRSAFLRLGYYFR